MRLSRKYETLKYSKRLGSIWRNGDGKCEVVISVKSIEEIYTNMEAGK